MNSDEYHKKMKTLHELNKVPGLSWGDKIAYLAYSLANDQTCPLTHIFEGHWYIREIFVPARHVFIGRPHVDGHICKLIKGDVLHITEEHRVFRTAPYQMLTTKGYQMVFYTYTDVIGRTMHPNLEDCRDIELLENQIFESRDSVLLRGKSIADKLLLEHAS